MMTRIGFLALLLIPTLAQASPSRMKIAADNEPGQRMIITGHVFDADGRPRGLGRRRRLARQQQYPDSGAPAI